MRVLTILFFSLLSWNMIGQQSLSELLKKHNKKNITYISVQELAMPKTDAIILDARELEEYNVSHIKNAIYVGYNDFNLQKTTQLLSNKHQKIIIYCSLGIRSETIANQLKLAGYTNVSNLYGGIFEWKNNNFSVVNQHKKETDSVHAFSKEWSKWLTNGIKVY
jgi:rhodanese-related sulfurtransferase